MCFVWVEDRYGHDKADLELIQSIDSDWLIADNQHVKLVAADRSWLVTRNKLNQRGDEASILQRQKNIEGAGIIRDVRGGPWLMQSDDPSNQDRYTALRWATLIEGAERAWRADQGRQNKCVQLSVLGGLSRCKIYSRKTPPDVCRYLVDVGNAFNQQATATTILEKWRSTALIEPQWFA